MYFGCHNHTQYSNITTGLDSINKLKDIVAKAKEFGMSGLAITNHDNLSEVIEINRMQKKLRKEDDPLVLAIGNEIYLVDEFDPSDKAPQTYFHFILIAKDKIGYQALTELSSRAWYRSEFKNKKRRVPTLKSDIEEILKDAKGHLVATTACLGGEFPKLVLGKQMDQAQEFLSWCQDQFGYEDFYIEMQPSTDPEQILFNKKSLGFDARHIIATDSHYQSKEDFPIFEAFLRSQKEDREVQEYYEFARMMSEEEIYSLMESIGIGAEIVNECLNNTTEIGEQIEFYDLDQKFHIPKVPVPRRRFAGPPLDAYPVISELLLSQDNQTNYCLATCLQALLTRGLWNDIYLSRLEEEMDVFKFQSEELNDNFFCYFNSMQHYIDLAWSVDCAVGPSRGSASGSLICYLMDIVQGDPVKMGYYGWRFANKVRASVLNCQALNPVNSLRGVALRLTVKVSCGYPLLNNTVLSFL